VTSVKVTEKISIVPNPAIWPVSLVAGAGVTLMVLALGIGAVQGAAADSSAIGLAFAGGLVLLVLGSVAWFAIAQPQKHFDDINVPAADEHHGHDSHADEHALAVTDHLHSAGH
jgi:hypothetical protein